MDISERERLQTELSQISQEIRWFDNEIEQAKKRLESLETQAETKRKRRDEILAMKD